LSITNKTAISTHMKILMSSSGQMPRSGTPGSQDKCVFKFLRNWPTVF
jgi:hypothetical protein